MSDDTAVAGPGSKDATHRRLRGRAITQGILTAIASRGVALLVAFLSVPLTIGYLGVERFGVWALLSSVLAWLRLADVGIGNGLNGVLSRAFALNRRDLVKEHISTALGMLTGIAVVVSSVGFFAVHSIEWADLLRLDTQAARDEIRPAMAAVVVIFALSLPLSVGARVYTAMQLGKVANGWGVAGNLLSLGALLVVTRTEGGLPVLVILVFGSTLLTDALGSAWLFFGRLDRVSPSFRALSRSSARLLLGTGLQFFLTQVMALIVFEFDNFVIAHELGAAEVGPYSIAYRLFAYSSIVQTLAFAYLWVAYSEAITRGDVAWIRRAFKWHIGLSTGLTTITVGLLLLLADPIIEIWAGPAFLPATSLMLLLAAWNLINAYCSPIACLFAASDHMRAQVLYGAVAAVANVFLSIWWVGRYGVNGVIAATVCTYLIFVMVPATVDLRRLLRRGFA